MNPEDEIVIDLSTSCTRDEAVALLLGWGRGHIFPSRIKVTETGIAEEDLKYVRRFEPGVKEQLLQLHEAARWTLFDAAERGEPEATLSSLEDKLRQSHARIAKAASYHLDLAEELAAIEQSTLKLDASATQESGLQHITLRSLDAWAQKKYGISVLTVGDDGTAQHVSLPSAQAVRQQPAAAPADENGARLRLERLQVTFAFCIDLISESAHKRYKHADRPNVAEIAEAIAATAAKASNEPNMKFQSEESIKGRIEAALKVKREALPQR